MLMMQAVFGVTWSKVGPADAHDAGGLGSHQVGPADAHDAGGFGVTWSKVRPADAHDAGGLGLHYHPTLVELTLMMQYIVQTRSLGPADAHDAGGLGLHGPKQAQLMCMMQAVWGQIVRSRPS